MPGTATLGTNLVDSLVPDVVDSLRDSLHTEMGVRQFRVFLVRRTWTGERRGEGTIADTVEAEITPVPLVARELEYRLGDGGLDEQGEVLLSEVSLTYTEAELTGGVINDAEDFFYEIRDGHGQGIATRRYVLAAPPEPDRIQTIGWKVKLRPADGLEDC